ncbi:MAG TPA: 3-dehydroquinate synthase [Candidatus Hydrogenedentes bacterium]|mgnify:CR=1 FL=1|nr:3-dehydroquinate synthase [Candidatus Hydrogenedentota bacterium]
MPTTLTVPLGDRAYPIHIGEGVLDLLPEVLRQIPAKGTVGVVTDSQVGPLYAARVLELVHQAGKKCVMFSFPAGEESKRLDQMEAICGAFLEGGLDRASLIIALGGGVVGDMAGFAAGVFMRGIPFIQIPTTIVSQVDSSVGGKTGVNHALGKNTIGVFHQPKAVLIDLVLLRTLPDRELRAGIAEIIKHGVIADADLFAHMETNAAAIQDRNWSLLEYPIQRSCEIKAAVVAEDETEQGLRAILNYGHTFGHAIEAVTHYTKYLHGEAVALGMGAAGYLACDLGMVDEAFVRRQNACCTAYGLPVSWREVPVEETILAMKKDKKVRAGTLKFVLPEAVGRVILRTDITEEQVRGALEALRGPA